MTKHSRLLYLLVVILFALGIFLRFWKTDQIPSGFSWDEASIGYNGWSVMKTGSDEWGEKLPLHFQAFGEWKLPTYIYSTIPFIYFLGLNELAVRLPSMISGILSAVLFGFIWYRLKGIKEAIFSGLLFLFSFWSFSLSRSSFEANVGVFVLLLAIVMILLKKKAIAVVLFSVLLYTYNGFRIFIPLFLPFMLFTYRRNISKANLLKLTVIFAVAVLPLVRFGLVNRSAFSRLDQVTAEGNRIKSFISNYVSHFQPEFLLLNGDNNLRHFSGKTGQFSYLTTTLALTGIYYLLKKKGRLEKHEAVVLAGLVLSPIPAAITKESPHSLRAICLLPAWLSMATLGFSYLKNKFNTWSSLNKVLAVVVFFVLLGQYGYFYTDYFGDYKSRSASDWQSGSRQLFTDKNLLSYDSPVYVTTSNIQPYIFQLYYNPEVLEKLSYDVSHPAFWHKSRLSRINNFYFVDVEEMASYAFTKQHGLYVVDPKEVDIIPEGVQYQTISTNSFPNFYLFEI